MTGQLYDERGDEIASWLKRTFEHELSDLAQHYPGEKKTFVIDWDELFVFDTDLALDVRDFPERFRETFAECVRDVVPQQALVDRTEGDDVVRKHPLLFEACDVAVVNKADLAGAVGADLDRMAADVAEVAPDMGVFRTNARADEGVDDLASFLTDLRTGDHHHHDHDDHDHAETHDHTHHD